MELKRISIPPYIVTEGEELSSYFALTWNEDNFKGTSVTKVINFNPVIMALIMCNISVVKGPLYDLF